MRELLKEIRDNKVLLEVVDGKLNVFTSENEVDPRLLSAIKAQKDALLKFLSDNNQDALQQGISPAPLQPHYALSSAQRRVWLLSQLPWRSKAYHMIKSYTLEGPLDAAAFSYAFGQLINRHESLRTIFKEDETGMVRQFILAASGFQLREYDLREEPQKDDVAADLVRQQQEEAFDLSKGPLIRACLLRMADNTWIFAYVMHHIISDGWSMGIIIRELLLLYNTCVSGKPSPLSALQIQYKDYAAWQLSKLKSEALQYDKAYWLRQLSGELPVLTLPTDFTRPAVSNYRGNIVRATFGNQTVKRMQLLLQQEGCTLFMGLLSAVYVLLHRYTGQEDLIIGTPTAGREHIDLEDQIGFFINTLALRASVRGADSFKETLAKIKQITLDAYEHQAYPFDELVTELKLAAEISRNVLFDVMVILQPNENYTNETTLAVNTYNKVEQTTSKFDLVFVFIEGKESLDIEIEYNTDLYNKSTIERLAGHVEQLLHAITEQPAIPLIQLDYLPAAEKLQLEAFNQTAVDFSDDKTLVHLFEEQAHKHPDKTALIFEDTCMTYAELNETANQLAHYLRVNYNIKADELVGIKMPRSERMIISIMGTLKSGAAYVPIDPEYPQERIDYLITDSQCRVVIDEEKWLRFEKSRHNYEKENSPVISRPTDLAYVIYTSGSTGRPKGCMLEHRGVINRIEWMWNQFAFDEEDIILQKTTYTFDVSVWEIFMPLCMGAKMILCSADEIKSPESISLLIDKHQISCLHFVPGMFHAFIRATAVEKLTSLKKVITSGEALSADTVRLWYSRTNVPVYNLYGPTEASVDVTYYVCTPGDTMIPIGRPIWNTQIYITDSADQLLPVGIPGEICIGGTGLARGYRNNPELTALKFVKHPFKGGEKIYRTGDLGRWLPDGNIEFLGRADDQVKLRGYRIEPGEIECALQSYPGIDTAVVLMRERDLVAYLLCKDLPDMSDVRLHLMKILPAYMLPAYYISIDKLPLTSSGKIDRKKLSAAAGVQLSDGIEYVTPETELERAIIAIAEEVTGKAGIGMKDSFFSSGGDSIKVITFVVNVKKQLGLEISVKKLYEARTMAEWVAYLKEQHADSVYKELSIGLEAISKIKAQIEEENKINKRLPADYEDIYPVVQIEQGMIFSSLMNPGEPVYYDQYSFVIRIDNLNAFRESLQQLVYRHPILRTKYYMSSFSRPVKVVLPEAVVPLTYEDLSGLSAAIQAEKISTYVARDLNVRLTFDNELLWRINLLRLDANEYCITYSVHHALLDGWSMAVLKTEIANWTGTAAAPLRYSYKDYCAISIGRGTTKNIEAYWKNLLKGYTRNKLPFNYKGLKICDETGMRKVSRTIDQQLLEKLHGLASTYQLSFKAICLAAHVCLLNIICAEQDVVTGVVTHERPEIEGGENILGCFLTTIPARICFDEQTDIISLLKQVNDFVSNVKPYEVHLSEIARIIGDKTSFGNPVFDTLLNYTDFHTFGKISSNHFVNVLQAGANTSEMEVSHEMTNTLFDVEVSKTLERFSARIKYAPAYFTERDVAYALNLYVRILEQFAADVSMPVAALNLLSPVELKEILIDFNATAAPYSREKSIQRLFEEQVLKTPDAVALRQDGMNMTYAELNRRANQLAAHLIRLGIGQGDNVGLLASRSFDMISGMFGILKAGAAYVPVDPEYPLDRQQYIIRNSGVQKVVTNELLQANKLEGITSILMTDTGEDLQNPDIVHHSNNLAYTIYTSGSTGMPKGVMIEHHSVVNLIEWVNETFQIKPADRLLFVTSMCFDLSVYDIFGMLAAGAAIVIARNEEVQQLPVLKRLLKEEHITCWDSVPTTMNYLITELEAEKDDYNQNELRLVLLSGDWIPVQLPGRIRKYFPGAKVISLGGATEGTVWSNYYPVSEVDKLWSSIPYGKPIKNNSFYILNDKLQAVPRGVVGELYIGGVGVARGYANDIEKTRASFKPDLFSNQPGAMMYKTGDLGRMLADGNMEFLGRKDNQVKIRGFRVELGEIESVLLRHDKVKAAIVHIHKDADNMNQLCAYLLKDQNLDIPDVKRYLKSQLPAYMIPAQYILLDSFPLNSNGKIDRKALPRPDQDIFLQLADYVAPVNEVQIRVERIWKSILNVERISIREDLFELGANSLSVGAFVNRVQREMDLALNIRAIFMNPTIETISYEIEKSRCMSAELFEAENSNDVENFSI